MPLKKKKTVALSVLERKIRHRFKNKELLRNALTHASVLSEQENQASYEVLEFFGDSILGFAVAEMLYRKHADLSEGEMTRLRSALVSAKSLSAMARELDLGRFILFGKGEEKTGGREKESILSATFEAVIAAIYLDGGIMKIKKFLKERFEKKVEMILRSGRKEYITRDGKSVLQELLHKRGEPLPEYVVVKEEGPPHDKKFYIELRVGGNPVACGKGRSKKEAEKEAARKALTILCIGR